ncbi:hypothetical protein [Poseidonibacter ostreae]|uniref:Uncharacterized protein n=1 Tax=Poseidonibacter ostreae TaxID=2654171 RepID=A0ABQ6VPS5_9BACT|nr:hypothetical protein [Poseidonibacter ostreae]KAB7892595.1 hypothetical protein GBG18_01695 [Poseidonibacter ostreae]
MGLCSKCNVVKTTHLIKDKQICDDCLGNNKIINDGVIKEQEINQINLEVDENKVGMTFKRTIVISSILSVVLVFILLLLTSNNEDKKILEIEESIMTIPKNDIYKNYKAYKALSKYYKENIEYKENYKKYNDLEKLSSECFDKGTLINREYALNKSSYSFNSFGDNKTIMIDDNTIVEQISFSVENDFGVKIKYLSKYRCNLDGSMKQIDMYRQ